jgi:hypothetical protein
MVLGQSPAQAGQADALDEPRSSTHAAVLTQASPPQVPSEQSHAPSQVRKLPHVDLRAETTDVQFVARQLSQAPSAAVGFLQTTNGALAEVFDESSEPQPANTAPAIPKQTSAASMRSMSLRITGTYRICANARSAKQGEPAARTDATLLQCNWTMWKPELAGVRIPPLRSYPTLAASGTLSTPGREGPPHPAPVGPTSPAVRFYWTATRVSRSVIW